MLTEATLPVFLETEEIVHTSAQTQNEVLIRKKRRGVKGVPLEQPKNPVEKLLLPKKVESLDDIFLKTEDQDVAKESPFDDFLHVKKNEKRSGQTKNVQPFASSLAAVASLERDDGITLAKLIGCDADSEEAKKRKASDAENAKLWAYLGGPQEKVNAGVVSFTELLKQAEGQPVRKVSIEDKSLGKDFHTKRAWGMAPEEVPPEDFEQIMARENEKREKERILKRADEELARRL